MYSKIRASHRGQHSELDKPALVSRKKVEADMTKVFVIQGSPEGSTFIYLSILSTSVVNLELG